MYKSFIPTMTMMMCCNLVLITGLNLSFFPWTNRTSGTVAPLISVMFSQLSRTSSTNLKGLTLIITSLFCMISVVNLLGMIPYTFSLSSHLLMTLVIGLPLWLSMIISSFMWNIKKTTAHFLPDGAPDWLNPFLVLIESTSIIVRPITLSFRLAANMTAGHIVLSLISIFMASSILQSPISGSMFLIFNSGYILFELAICMIQAYIFCLLLSLYSDDHSS